MIAERGGGGGDRVRRAGGPGPGGDSLVRELQDRLGPPEVRAHDDLIVDVGDVHDEADVVAKVIGHDAPQDVEVDVVPRVAHVRAVVHRRAADVPPHAVPLEGWNGTFVRVNVFRSLESASPPRALRRGGGGVRGAPPGRRGVARAQRAELRKRGAEAPDDIVKTDPKTLRDGGGGRGSRARWCAAPRRASGTRAIATTELFRRPPIAKSGSRGPLFRETNRRSNP